MIFSKNYGNPERARREHQKLEARRAAALAERRRLVEEGSLPYGDRAPKRNLRAQRHQPISRKVKDSLT